MPSAKRSITREGDPDARRPEAGRPAKGSGLRRATHLHGQDPVQLFPTIRPLLGAPEGFTVTVRDLKVSAGAGFLVALTGDIMTMPGLPKIPLLRRLMWMRTAGSLACFEGGSGRKGRQYGHTFTEKTCEAFVAVLFFRRPRPRRGAGRPPWWGPWARRWAPWRET